MIARHPCGTWRKLLPLLPSGPGGFYSPPLRKTRLSIASANAFITRLRRFIYFWLFAGLMAQRGIPFALCPLLRPPSWLPRSGPPPSLPAASMRPAPRIRSAFGRFRIPSGLFADLMAEREGFEPSVHCCTYDFQSYPFGLSGISPYKTASKKDFKNTALIEFWRRSRGFKSPHAPLLYSGGERGISFASSALMAPSLRPAAYASGRIHAASSSHPLGAPAVSNPRMHPCSILAEREGFEPPVPSPEQLFSRQPPSASRASLRVVKF